MYFHTICEITLVYISLIVSFLPSATPECNTPIVISGNSSSPRPMKGGEPIAFKPLGDKLTKIIVTIYDHRLSNLLLTVAITEVAVKKGAWQINGKVGNYGRFANRRRGNNLKFKQDYIKGEWMYLYINLDVVMKDSNVTEVKLKSRGGETTRIFKTQGLTSGSKAAILVGYKGNKAPFLVSWNCSHINDTIDVSTTTETVTTTLVSSTEQSYMQSISNFPRNTEISYFTTSYAEAIPNSTLEKVDKTLNLKEENKTTNSRSCKIVGLMMTCSSLFFKWIGCSIIVLIAVFILLGITGQFNCYPETNKKAAELIPINGLTLLPRYS
ncbi:unnamed protein product [Meganyctiphanes norvegica]|uniref:Uncharacterized protein n=1 Tax=Meganyctiphanes norvegica TaxID=48144 RepID=A0AAV2QEZ4_MEGNR